MISHILVMSLFFALTLGTPLSPTYYVHERRETVPSGFTLNGPASPDTVLTLRIALVQSDPKGLEEALYAVSTPSSPTYRQYLTKEEAAQLNATMMTPAGDWLSVQMRVSQANQLFETEFKTYTYEATGKQTIRTLEYSIPAGLIGHVDLVHPTTTFPIPSSLKPQIHAASNRTVARQDGSCAYTITPSCLQSLYNIPTTPATQSSNVFGVTGYGNEWPLQDDLSDFLQEYRPDMSPSTSYSLTTLYGGSDPQEDGEAGLEADLDIQYTVGLATGVPVTFISVGENTDDGLEGWLNTINYLLNQDAPPQTMSTSYGLNENDFSSNLANNYCNAAAQLGARGVSIIFASGDGGVSGSQNQYCSTFQPVFPASCPFVTSVGATTGVSPETAASLSSGGFSNYFNAPSYQSDAISSYLDGLGDTYQGLFNTSGRGFPDVSAQGENFVIVQNGQVTPNVAGTSCASPTFASVIALINDQLAASGESPLGFLNPFLYSTAAGALNDITSGSNPGCDTNGFSAGTGWDPVTGLGTPNYDALLSAAGL